MERERLEPSPRPVRRPTPERGDDADALARLQAAAGNRAVVQLLAQGARHPAAVVGRAGPVVQRTDSLDRIGLDRNLDKQGTPDTLALPAELRAGLATAWTQSFPEGRSCEQGGILVKTVDGRYVWRAGPPGTTGTFRVNYTDLQPGEVLIASGHTHPYDATEGGHTDVAFSAADLANLVTGAERVKFVQSGATRFAVAKTAEFDALVAAADTVEKKRTLMGEMRETWNAASRASTRRTFQGKVLDAVGAVADRYHLVYYQGSGDDLAKATPWVHVESVAPRLPTDPAALPAVPPQVAATAQQPAAQQPVAPGGTAAAPAEESWLSSVVRKIRGWMGW